MKTLISILIASAIIQIIWFFFNIKRKSKKVYRSQEAFDSVANEKCICDNPCNKYCGHRFKL